MSLRWLSWERCSGRSIADGFLTFLCIEPLRLHEHAQVVADIPFQFELGLLRLAIVLDVDDIACLRSRNHAWETLRDSCPKRFPLLRLDIKHKVIFRAHAF